MAWTNQDHNNALAAAKSGTADKRQMEKLTEASKQYGSRGREAARAVSKQQQRR